jgi:hypothetical protein
VPLLDDEEVRDLEVRDVAEQVVGHRVAGEGVAEAHRAADRRHVQVLVLHRGDDVRAELQRVAALQPRQAVDELELVGVLELRQEVRRADAAEPAAAEVAVDRDAGEAAGDHRVRDRAGDRGRPGRRETERLVHGVGNRARP